MPLQRQGNSLRIIHRTVQIFSPAHMAPQDPIPSFLEEPSFGPGFFVSCHSIFILVHATKALSSAVLCDSYGGMGGYTCVTPTYINYIIFHVTIIQTPILV